MKIELDISANKRRAFETGPFVVVGLLAIATHVFGPLSAKTLAVASVGLFLIEAARYTAAWYLADPFDDIELPEAGNE